MLNMNVYSTSPPGGLFSNGFHINLGEIALNRYVGGELKGSLKLFTLISSATGHLPFRLFGFDFLTGDKSAWQLTVLGLTVGSRMVHDYDSDTGQINGPDYRKGYWYFSCLKHQTQTTQENY